MGKKDKSDRGELRAQVMHRICYEMRRYVSLWLAKLVKKDTQLFQKFSWL